MSVFRIKDHPTLAATEVRLREAKRLLRLARIAMREGTALGHDLRAFELDHGWRSAVTTCCRCRRLAAIDWTERPYLFGRAYHGRCGERPGRASVIDLGSITVGEMQ